MKKEPKIKFVKNIKWNKLFFRFIYFLIIICIIYSIVYFIHTTKTKKDYLDLFGIKLFVIENNLMEDDLNKNDLIIIKQQELQNLQIGDIIAYNFNNQIKINKIVKINEDNLGNKVFITKYNKNFNMESEEVLLEQILGRKIANYKVIGFIVKLLQSNIMIFFNIIVLVLYFLYNIHVHKLYKARSRKKINN